MDDGRSRVLNPSVTRVARWGIVAWSAIGVAILAFFVYRYVVWPIRVVFPPLVLALVLVYLLNPIVSRLQRRGIPRGWATLLTYLIFAGIVFLGMRLLVPVVAGQVAGFVEGVPRLLQRLQGWIADIAARFDLNIDARSLVGNLGPEGGGGAFIGRIFSFTAGVFHVAIIVILGPILAFYLLVDLPKIQRGFDAMIPMNRRDEVHSILQRMSRALGGFFRGQLLVALFVGLASMLALWIVGLPYWALVGMICGLFNLIPLVGPFIGAVPALFIAFTTPQSEGLLSLEPGWPLAIGASVALLIVQQIDNHIISPNVVARTVKLHPVTVMLGLLVGGTLLGLWGMLLAVPTIAAAKILMLHFWDTRAQWPPSAEPGSAPEVRVEAAADEAGAEVRAEVAPAPARTAAPATARNGSVRGDGRGTDQRAGRWRRWWRLGFRPRPADRADRDPEARPAAKT